MNYYFQALSQEFLGATVSFLPEFLSGLFVLSFFYLLNFFAGLIFKSMAKRSLDKKHNVWNILRTVTRLILLIIGVVTMLGTWGIDVSAIITGLGLTGFAFGFALKDTLSSILAGVMIMLYRPFSINDKIETCGVEGTVKSIDVRYTTIEDNGHLHLIPNSKIMTEKVTIV